MGPEFPDVGSGRIAESFRRSRF